MNSRERTLAAIRHETPDRIPVDVICIENVDKLTEREAISPEEVYPRLGIDGRVVAAGYTGEIPQSDCGAWLNEWSSPAIFDYGTIHAYPISMDATPREIERFPWPDPKDYDYESAARLAAEFSPEYAVRGPYWKPIFCQVCDMIGMEDAMVMMSVNRAGFEAVVDRIFEHVHEYVRRMLDACGDDLHILCLGDDFATQMGLMISPDQWRRYLKPRFAEVFALGKDRGKPVWFHSCGNVLDVLPDLIEIGVDVWETVQLHTLPLTPSELKREFGRDITFFGGVNTQRLPFVGPDDVREEVIRCIEVLGDGGGYMCGPDHHIKPDVSAENTLALFDTATGFRRPGYTL